MTIKDVRYIVGEHNQKAFADALTDICDFAEKRMSQFTRELDGQEIYRTEIEEDLFMPAYRPLSALWGEARKWGSM